MAIELPIKYYLDYYNYMVSYVLRHYSHLLESDEMDFISSSQLMEEDAFCLYLRMAGRRYLFFRASQLNYEEINDVPNCLEELVKAYFIEPLKPRHQPMAYDWLQTYNKGELWQAYTELSAKTELKKSIRKEALLMFLLENFTFESLLNYFVAQEPVYVQGRLKEEQLVRFLFFGNLYGSVTDFVVRDVGHRKFEEHNEENFVPIFNTRKEVEECWVLGIASQQWKIVAPMLTPEIVMTWFYKWFKPNYEWTDKAQTKLDKLLLKTGKYLEQKKLLEQALEIYQHTTKPPSRERQARLLVKLERKDEAIALCEQLELEAQNATEKIFAKDFLARLIGKDNIKSTRKKLKQADEIELDESWKYSVEQGVLGYYQQQGYQGIHCENFVWRSLFGVIFWELLFDSEAAAIHHPLQRSPSDLHLPNFYDKRKEQIETCLERLKTKKAFEKHLSHIFEEKWGITNSFVVWDETVLELLKIVYAQVKGKALKTVLLEMTKNVRENSRGFPDLFIWKQRTYCFVEVKSPTDMLSEQQLFWQDFFEEHGIKCKVLKVVWK